MAISFSNIPSNLRVPLAYFEFDPSMAATSVGLQRALLLGTVPAGAQLAPNALTGPIGPRIMRGNWPGRVPRSVGSVSGGSRTTPRSRSISSPPRRPPIRTRSARSTGPVQSRRKRHDPALLRRSVLPRDDRNRRRCRGESRRPLPMRQRRSDPRCRGQRRCNAGYRNADQTDITGRKPVCSAVSRSYRSARRRRRRDVAARRCRRRSRA